MASGDKSGDGKAGDGKTHIISGTQGNRGAADTDNMVTTIRSVTAGRLVVTEGPGKGKSIDFHRGTNSIGREAGKNVIVMDFGDASIHRDNHAFLTCKDGVCQLHDNGKRNPIKVNGIMLEGTQVVTPSDTIEIGMTKVRIELN